MTRYEVAGREANPGAAAWCARPEDHPGQCRTRESLRRSAQAALRLRTVRYRAARAVGLTCADAKRASKSDRQFTLATRKAAA
jgi:hypothetical protein